MLVMKIFSTFWIKLNIFLMDCPGPSGNGSLTLILFQVGQYDKVVSQMRRGAGARADVSGIVDIIFAHKQCRF